jgi:copper resistance protein D
MRLAVAIVLIVGLFSVLLVFEWDSNASVPDTHHAVNQVNHDPTVHREASFEDRSQDPDIAYSLFMHHSSGIVVLTLGLLILLDRLSFYPRGLARILIGCTWLLFGAFVFIKSDPEGWPIGNAGFLESFKMPTASEWIQHKLLSLIPMVLGVYSISFRRVPPSINSAYWAAGAALLGGIGLIVHQHADHPEFDLVNLQHWIYAVTIFFIAVGLLVERWRIVTWKSKPFFVPLGIMLLGIQLTLYVE